MFRSARWRVEKNKIKLVFKLQFRATQGLQDVIKLVPIDLRNRPTWYKEKVYPPNKVPSLEPPIICRILPRKSSQKRCFLRLKSSMESCVMHFLQKGMLQMKSMS